MSKPSCLIIASAALIALAASANASSFLVATQDPSIQVPGAEAAAAEPFIAAIKNEETSIVRAEPKCGNGTTLRGVLVIETPRRDGFPFDATTFASPRGTYTNVTATGDESEAVIREVAKTLNNRANNYVRRLLRNCSL
jgi:hypothetical protein